MRKWPKDDDNGKMLDVRFWSVADGVSVMRVVAVVILLIALLLDFYLHSGALRWQYYHWVWLPIALSDALDGWMARRYGSSLRGPKMDEQCDKVAVGLALIVLGIIGLLSWYFIAIMIIRDIVVTMMRNRAATSGASGVKAAKWPGKVKTVAQCALIFVALWPHAFAGTAVVVIASATVILSVVSGLQIVILAMAAMRPSMLLPLKNRIGAANWISATRMGLILLVPYIYVAQPAGEVSNLLALGVLAIAVLTDGVDGFVARRRKEVTEIGRTLDPLCDKFLFYAPMAGILIAGGGIGATVNGTLYMAFVMALFVIMVRDATFIALWALASERLDATAMWADKVRFFVLAVWLLAAAIRICLPQASTVYPALGWVGVSSILAGAVFSIISAAIHIRQLRI